MRGPVTSPAYPAPAICVRKSNNITETRETTLDLASSALGVPGSCITNQCPVIVKYPVCWPRPSLTTCWRTAFLSYGIALHKKAGGLSHENPTVLDLTIWRSTVSADHERTSRMYFPIMPSCALHPPLDNIGLCSAGCHYDLVRERSLMRLFEPIQAISRLHCNVTVGKIQGI